MGQILAVNNDRSQQLNIVDICRGFRDNQFKNVVVMTGPGISTPPEMEDFVYNGEGFYGLIEPEYDISKAEEVLSYEEFENDPRPFFAVLNDIYDLRVRKADVTFIHKFLKVLDDKGCLRRVYTSNVDSVELRAGITPEKVIEVHGTLRTSRCMKCRRKYDSRWLARFMRHGNFDSDKGDISYPKCEKCKEAVKPDVVLFGEDVSERFFQEREADMEVCDLLIMMGTRLSVQPFCSLVKDTMKHVPRLYINNAKPNYGTGSDKFNLNREHVLVKLTDIVITRYRIDFYIGDICNHLRWMKAVNSVKEIEEKNVVGFDKKKKEKDKEHSRKNAIILKK